MARWDRAIAALPFRHGRVLDVGCAFGFATLRLAHKGYETVGVDNSARYISWAKGRHPEGEYLLASADALPLEDASFDAVLLLDVLEHVSHEAGVIHEIERVLKPGGVLILSVPHCGLLSRLNSLNVYAKLVRYTGHGLFPQEIVQTGIHRHYTLQQVRDLLGPVFCLQRATCTGLGIAELLNLPLLVLCRYILLWEMSYQILQYLYFLVYLLEDMLPLGRAGYHLMVVATKDTPPSAC